MPRVSKNKATKSNLDKPVKTVKPTPARRRSVRSKQSTDDQLFTNQPLETTDWPTRPNQNNYRLSLVLSLLAVVVAIVLAVWYWSVARSTVQPADSQVVGGYEIPLGVTVTPPVDPTASWLTYKQETDYEFKHPSSTAVTIDDNETIRFFLVASSTSEVTVIASTTSLDLAAYLSSLDEVSSQAYEGQPAIKVIQEQSSVVAGQPVRQRYQQLLAADLMQLITYIPVNGRIVSLALTGDQITEAENELYNQILETFKIVAPVAPLTIEKTTTSTATSTSQ